MLLLRWTGVDFVLSERGAKGCVAKSQLSSKIPVMCADKSELPNVRRVLMLQDGEDATCRVFHTLQPKTRGADMAGFSLCSAGPQGTHLLPSVKKNHCTRRRTPSRTQAFAGIPSSGLVCFRLCLHISHVPQSDLVARPPSHELVQASVVFPC